MAKQTVNLGTMADNKSGDPLRTAFTKINENFDELYDQTGSGVGVNVGDQTTEPSQVADIVFDGATVVNADGVSTVTITPTPMPNIGDVTFSGTTITGASLNQAGSIIYIDTNYNGDQPGVNGTSVQVSQSTPNIDQVQAGWIITLATGYRVPIIASYNWAQGGFWVLQWDQNYSTSDPVFPLTVESADYQVGDPTHLVLSSGQTSPGSAIDIKETEIDMNFAGTGTAFKFSPQGLVFPDHSVQTTASAGGGSGSSYLVGLSQYNGDWHNGAPNIFDLNDWLPYDVTVFSQNGAQSDISVILPDNYEHGKMITIKCADWTNLDYNLIISSNHNIDNVSQTVSTQKNGGFVTFVWDNQWNTWWIIGKDII